MNAALIAAIVALTVSIGRSIWLRRFVVDVSTYEAVARKLLESGRADRLEKVNVASSPALYPTCMRAAARAFAASPRDAPASFAFDAAMSAFREARAHGLRRIRADGSLEAVQLLLALYALVTPVLALHPLNLGTIALSAVALLLLADARVQRGRLQQATAERAAPLLELLSRAGNARGPYRERGEGDQPPPPSKDLPRHLVAFRAGQPVASVALDRDVIKIGRLASVQLRLDDASVARMHAVIERNDDGFAIIDLGSATGTFVDGVRVNRSAITTASRIDIGPFRLELHIEDAPPPPKPKRKAAAVVPDRERQCSACGGRGFDALPDAPEAVVPTGYRGESCRRCGKVELFVQR